MYAYPPQNALYTMLVGLIVLIIATLVHYRLRRRYPEENYRELQLRITSWWWMLLVLFGFLAAGKTAAIVFFACISFLALKEFLSIVPTRRVDRRAVFWLYVAIPFQYYWVAIGWYGMFTIFIPVFMFLFIPMRMVLQGETKGFINAAGTLHWAVMLTVFSLSHLAYLLVLPVINPLSGATGLVLFILLLTQCNDVNQYVWGKLLGRHKIIPLVSPNKTWEGFLGGLLTTTVITGLVAPFLTPMTHREGFVAGVIISAGGFFGDVVISSVKRDLHIKDCGRLIPGHGGILDRIDSLTYTAPLFFHLIYYLHY